ncbi:6-phosphogluconolactonase, partial [Candidatus Woesearchaeota archaeon]|nr:6-phosphogluconolactonase [Candidatus Woesearchaeota archaeon]
MKKTDCKNLDIIVGSRERVSELIAEHIAAQMIKKGGKISIGAACGSSTAGVYMSLNSISSDLSGITAFTADEFLGTDDQKKSIEKQLPGAKVYAPDAIFVGKNQSDLSDIMSVYSSLQELRRSYEAGKYEYFESKRFRSTERAADEYEKDFDSIEKCSGRGGDIREIISVIDHRCKAYEKQIANAGGMAILLLGLGIDPPGHIASIMPKTVNINEGVHLEEYIEPHKTSNGTTDYAITIG